MFPDVMAASGMQANVLADLRLSAPRDSLEIVEDSMTQTQPGVQVMIYGLEGQLATELLDAVAKLGVPVDRQAFRDAQECRLSAADSVTDIIFCSPDSDRVRALRASHPTAFIIAASRLPDVSDWLDAIEAGANDYCASPFEPTQVRWILESSLRHHSAAA